MKLLARVFYSVTSLTGCVALPAHLLEQTCMQVFCCWQSVWLASLPVAGSQQQKFASTVYTSQARRPRTHIIHKTVTAALQLTTSYLQLCLHNNTVCGVLHHETDAL
jgi:hypothetical protein